MKKFLSLVLALVMTMSLVTVSAGAKDFTDNSKINYKEAVDVMSAVKVIDGYAEGDFRPTATLTRGAAAKIICNMILGPTTANALVADAAPYSDVPVNHTFAGDIAYCQKEGIISGYADGTFRPAASLTGYAFMKMLLGALGYDAAVENYTGANWSINVAKRALNIGLDDDLVGDFNGVKAVNREEACLYAFNTLKATMVEYDSKTNISVGGAEVVVSGSSAKEVAQGSYKNNLKKADLQFAEKYFTDLKKDITTDEFERPATTWNVKSTEVGTYSDTPDLTYTSEVKVGTIYSDLGLSKAIPGADVTVYVDGTTNSTEAGKVANGIVKGEVSKKLGGNGVLTEVFYDDDDNTVIITEINTYIGEIAAAYKATATRDAYVTLKAGTSNTGIGSSYETDDTYAVDSKVLYTYSNKAGDVGVQSMKAAESVTGTLTAYTVQKDVTVGGTTYKANNVAASKSTIGTSLTNAVKTDVVVYLDDYGYAIYVDADAASDNYAVVLGYDGAANGAGTLGTTNKADLLFMDGTRKTVDVKGSFGGNGIVLNDVVSYRINSDDEYVLTEVASAATVANSTALVTKGTTTMNNATYNKGTTGASAANGKTVFLFWNAADKSIDRYEGIANVSTFTTSASTSAQVSVLVENGAAAAKLVFVSYGAGDILSGAKKDTLFIKGSTTSTPKYDADRNTYYEYDAILNGEITKVQTANQIPSWTLTDNFTKDSKDVITVSVGYYVAAGYTANSSSVAAVTSADSGKLVYAACSANAQNDAVVNGTITLAGVARSVADDVEVFTIDDNGDIAASTINAIQLDSDDEVWYKLNSDNEVEFILLKDYNPANSVPGTPAAGYTATLAVSNSTATLTVTGTNTTSVAVTGTVTMTNTVSGAKVTFDLAGGNVVSGTPYTATFAVAGATCAYQATVNVGGATVTSNTVLGA